MQVVERLKQHGQKIQDYAIQILIVLIMNIVDLFQVILLPYVNNMKLKIISDGTKLGTELINSDTGQAVEGISKLTWKVDVSDLTTKTIVELINIPVEIVSKATVDLVELTKASGYVDEGFIKSFDKNVKIISQIPHDDGYAAFYTRIFNADTLEAVGGVQAIKLTVTAKRVSTKVKKLKISKKEWV